MKKLTTILGSFFLSITLYAQVDLSSVFETMPLDLLVGVDKEQKHILVSGVDTSQTYVINSIEEKIERIGLSADYIALKTSKAGTIQVKLLPLINNTYIVAVIKTVCGTACDSYINFYTEEWQPLDGTELFPKVKKEWFLTESFNTSSTDVRNAYAVLDMTPVKFSFSPNNTDIQVEYEIKKYLTKGDYELLEPYLIKTPKVLHWNKQSYE